MTEEIKILEIQERDTVVLPDHNSPGSEVVDYFQSNSDLLASLKKIDTPYSSKTLLDEGGMKKVYTCKDLRSDRIIAMAEIKEPDDEEKLNDFLREAKITAYLQHPNIIPVYEIGLNEKGIPFFTMKLIHGQSLGEIIRKLKKGDEKTLEEFPLSRLIDIYEKVCEAIAYAHSKGVLHLDIKPDNISVSDYGEVLVCDWGISDLSPESFEGELLQKEEFKTLLPLQKNDKMIRGTIPFMAPEQVNSNLASKTPLTDIYALGVLLYSLLTLEVPFNHTNQKDELKAVLKGGFQSPNEISPDKGIPRSLDAICMKAMHYKPDDRYTSVMDMLTEIHRFQNGYATEAEDASILEMVTLLYKRNKQTCWTAGIALLFIISAATLSMLNIRESERIAITERNKAVDSSNEAHLLLNELKTEQQQKLKLASEAAGRYLETVKNSLHFKNYLKADETIKTVWELGAHDEVCQKFYSWYQVSLLNLDGAIALFKQIPDQQKYLPMLEAAHKDLNVENVLKISSTIADDFKQKDMAGYFLHNCIDKSFTIQEKLLLLENELKTNSEGEVNFKYSIDDKGILLDISGSKVAYPGSLHKFNIYKLDVSETSISKPEYIPWSSTKILDISNTQVKNLGTASQLISLNLANCKLRNYSKFYSMKNLEYLDISGVKKFPMEILKKLPKLHLVILDKSQKLGYKGKFEVMYK